jgi:Tol biopolymer transport system component/PKD repeat protein
MLLVGILSVSIFSLNTFVMLPAAVVSNQPQPLQSAFATVPGENGKMVFISNRDGNYEIYVMNSDGSEQTRLTDNPTVDQEPSWSPDGTKIVFVREGTGGGTSEIYVMNSDGSEQTNISNNPAHEHFPTWSPDGEKIVFSSYNGSDHEIYVMNSDGSEQTNISNNPETDAVPSWSPDGTKIAFASYRDGNSEIYVMNSDGSEQTRLTNNPTIDTSPDWSPDGEKIVFRSGFEFQNPEIYVMNSDGSEQTNISNNPSIDFDPSWSPDGTKIAFTSYREGAGDVFIMNPDGSEQTNISNYPRTDAHPDWGTALDAEEEDVTSPIIIVPEGIVADATTANGGTVVTYNVTAEDNVDGTARLEEDGATITQDDVGGNITISCDPPSGSEFPIGDTEVQCTATDSAGNIGGPASFTVTVLPPQPDPLTVEISSDDTQGDAPATFEFEAMVTGGTQPYTYSWDFGDATTEEESIEPTTSHTYDESGTYTVTLTVTDANGQQASDSLEVTVNEPPEASDPAQATEELISDIQNLQGVSQSTKTSLSAPLRGVVNILNDDNPNNDNSACGRFGAFINQVNAAERRGSLTADQADGLRSQTEDIRDMLDC